MPRTFIAIAALLLPATAVVSQGMWYPDWYDGTELCINANATGTAATLPLIFQRGGYTETTQTACCQRYYTGTAYTHCTADKQGNYTGTGKFYVDWSAARCAKDCALSHGNPACGGVLGSGTVTTYADAEQCCAGSLAYMNGEFCLSKSVGHADEYLGTGRYYLESSANMCVQDCGLSAPCGGIVEHAHVELFDASGPESCCKAKLPALDPLFCKNLNDPTSTGTGKWHSGASNGYCVKDCDSGTECVRASAYDKLYDTAMACCKEKKMWMEEDFCASRSDPATYGIAGAAYTGHWYADLIINGCKKDCATASASPECKGLSQNAPLYDSAALCCAGEFSWKASATCTAAAINGTAAVETGTSEWYAIFGSANRCVTDCAVKDGGTCNGIISVGSGVTTYSDAKSCCSAKFSWQNQDLCNALSVGSGTGYTNQWYVTTASDGNYCVQDCATSGAGTCAGNPSDLGTPMYASAATCCSTKLPWVEKATCENRSGNGADADPVATGKWYADETDKKCKQDCAVGGGSGCAGVITANSFTRMYDTVTACCSGGMAWINAAICEARSTGGYTNKYYADQSKQVCYMDCAISSGSPMCGGNPTDLTSMLFDTADACCKSKLQWVNSATCSQNPAALEGDTQWWVRWQGEKCVQNCPKDSGPSCGGLAETWDELYPSARACCDRLIWKGLTDCLE